MNIKLEDKMMNALQKQLFAMQDLPYRDFHSKLMPTIDKETIIGVRTPELRKFGLSSGHVYTIRYGIGMLLSFYLDEEFKSEYLEWVAQIHSDEYYINMMIAWYFATALAKQYDVTIKYIEEQRLDAWTHNKAIQKAVESYRITDEQKKYLRTLKMRNKEK